VSVKHDADCECRTCTRRAAAPSLDLSDMRDVIAASIDAVFETRGVVACKVKPAWVEQLTGPEHDALYTEAAEHAAAALEARADAQQNRGRQ
jgi:hypothetical protein